MSVNKHLPHVLVLPEDDANRELANGFLLDSNLRIRNIQILEEVGGWNKVVATFLSDHIPGMERFPQRRMTLLIDCDGRPDRLDKVRALIPANLADRVFVLGTLTEPEGLRKDLGSYEAIGLKMAADCREDTDVVWAHDLLKHNEAELERLRQHVRPILF